MIKYGTETCTKVPECVYICTNVLRLLHIIPQQHNAEHITGYNVTQSTRAWSNHSRLTDKCVWGSAQSSVTWHCCMWGTSSAPLEQYGENARGRLDDNATVIAAAQATHLLISALCHYSETNGSGRLPCWGRIIWSNWREVLACSRRRSVYYCFMHYECGIEI